MPPERRQFIDFIEGLPQEGGRIFFMKSREDRAKTVACLHNAAKRRGLRIITEIFEAGGDVGIQVWKAP